MEPITSIDVTVAWRAESRVPERARRKIERLLRHIAPLLNEYEAILFDASVLASNGADYLMPRIALNLPLYEEGCTFTLHMSRLEESRMWITRRDEDAALADVHLV